MEEDDHDEVEDWYAHMVEEHMDDDECHEEGEDWSAHMGEHMEGDLEEDECHVDLETPITQ